MSDLHYNLNWERIFGSQGVRGSAYLLPSETAAIIVQSNPDFRITALFPPKTRDLQINYRGRAFERTHQTTFLLFSQLIYTRQYSAGFDPSDWFGIVEDQFYKPELPTFKASTYSSTWKELFLHSPWCRCKYCSVSGYFEARVVNNYYLFAVNPVCEDSIQAQPYRLNNVYPDGRCCFQRKREGSNRTPKNLRQAHNRFWMDYFCEEFQHEPAIHVSCNGKSHFDLHARCSEENLRHCYCCRNICECPCNCDIPKLFADQLANYQPRGDWEDHSGIICGKEFISYPKSADAVFASSDRELLKIIPEKYHKTLPNRTEKFIVGPMWDRDGKWDVDLLGLQFTLNKEQVAIIQ